MQEPVGFGGEAGNYRLVQSCLEIGADLVADEVMDKAALPKLTKVTFLGFHYYDCGWRTPAPVTIDEAMIEADFHNKHLNEEGAIIIAAFISRASQLDNAAFAKLDISCNDCPSRFDRGSKEFIAPIATMLKTNRTIKVSHTFDWIPGTVA